MHVSVCVPVFLCAFHIVMITTDLQMMSVFDARFVKSSDETASAEGTLMAPPPAVKGVLSRAEYEARYGPVLMRVTLSAYYGHV